MFPPEFQNATCYLNGEFTRLADAKISALDRGFIFGDGVYEVIPYYYRKPFRFEQHYARLERSLREIGLVNPMAAPRWREVLGRLVDDADALHQYVYLQVTRGVARRDFHFPKDTTPTVFAMTTPYARPSAEQRERGLVAVTRDDERWLRCDIKSVSLLGAVLARQFAVEHGADEVVQFRDGALTEGSASNVWVVRGGRLIGAPRGRLILEGIRYGFVGELAAAAGIPFEERKLTREQVAGADELMLSAATREILPIVKLDGRPIGSGQPGPVYAKLRAGYDAAIEALKSA
jgi:D-alanine transaminase